MKKMSFETEDEALKETPSIDEKEMRKLKEKIQAADGLIASFVKYLNILIED